MILAKGGIYLSGKKWHIPPYILVFTDIFFVDIPKRSRYQWAYQMPFLRKIVEIAHIAVYFAIFCTLIMCTLWLLFYIDLHIITSLCVMGFLEHTRLIVLVKSLIRVGDHYQVFKTRHMMLHVWAFGLYTRALCSEPFKLFYPVFIFKQCLTRFDSS